MTSFANFLFLNEIPKNAIAKYLGVSNSFITKLCKGNKSLPDNQRVKIISNPYNWDTSMLVNTTCRQTIGNNSSNNSQTIPDSDLWKKLCEEKDKRIAELERTISILMNNGK